MKILKATIDVCNNNSITYFGQAGTVLGAIRHHGPIPWDYDADLVIPNDQIDRFVECANRDLPSDFFVDYYKTYKGSTREFPRVGYKGLDTNKIHLDIFRLIGLPDDRAEQEDLLKKTKRNSYFAYSIRVTPTWKLIGLRNFKALAGRYGLNKQDLMFYVHEFETLCNAYPFAEANYVANPSGKYGPKNIFKKEAYGDGIEVEFLDFKIRIPAQYDMYLKQYYGDYMQTPPQEEINKAMNKVFKF